MYLIKKKKTMRPRMNVSAERVMRTSKEGEKVFRHRMDVRAHGACATEKEDGRGQGVLSVRDVLKSQFVVVRTFLGDMTMKTSEFMEHMHNMDLVVGVM